MKVDGWTFLLADRRAVCVVFAAALVTLAAATRRAFR